jgi:hypothetical protein
VTAAVAALTGTIVATSSASGPAPTAAAAAGVFPHAGAGSAAPAGLYPPGAARGTAAGATPVHQAAPAHGRPGHSAPPTHPAKLASAGRAVHLSQPAARAKPAQPARPQHASVSPPSPCASATLPGWICQAEQVMAQHGTPGSALSTGAAYIVVMHESNGNPRAYNGWDSNAAAGHPSEGIAQVIGPTFQAYALPGHSDIWNPVDNMIAAFRYAISRYGSMNNIPGVVAVHQGGSYVGY